MAINRNQFSLFGIDLVAGYDYIRTGLHELLYDENQWLRRRLDPIITLVTSSGAKQTFKAGALMPGDNSDRKTANPLYAIALPESKVLLQELCLPASLRYQVERIVMNEVSALSPFPQNDTSYGWRIVHSDANSLDVLVAICATSTVSGLLRDSSVVPGPFKDQCEVWYQPEESGAPIVFSGFGESRRLSLYRRQLVKAGALVGYSLVVVGCLLALPVMVKHMQLENLNAQLNAAQESAAPAIAARQQLMTYNQRAVELQEQIAGQPEYSDLLAFIADVTPDDVYLQGIEIESSGDIKLTGNAQNASLYMQTLIKETAFTDVQALQAFRRDGRTGLERFVIDLKLSASGGQQ